MTLLKTAKQALEALFESQDEIREWGNYASDYFQKKHDLLGSIAKLQPTIDTLRQAIEQAEKQEPVAWMYVNEDDECEQIEYGEPFDDPFVTPLYTAPPQRPWVGLTDEERLSLIAYEPHPLANKTAIINAVEQLLKEKNT